MKKYLFYCVMCLFIFTGCKNKLEHSNLLEKQNTRGSLSMPMTSSDILSNCQGRIYGDVCYLVYQFGYNRNITNGNNGSSPPTPAILSTGNLYQMPDTPQSLFVESDSSDDTATGIGAREITIEGLDENWHHITTSVATNGTSAVAITPTFLRVYRAYVSKSGVYLKDTPFPTGIINGSNIGAIRIYSATQDWAYITGPDASSSTYQSELALGSGQTEIGAYSVPKGYTAVFLQSHATIPTNKSASIYIYNRSNADFTSIPSDGVFHLFYKAENIAMSENLGLNAMTGEFKGPTDLVVLGKLGTNGKGEIGISFQLLLLRNEDFSNP